MITKPKLVFQNGNEREFETYNEAWEIITNMVLNDDLVWVDFYPSEKPYELTRIRKGF